MSWPCRWPCVLTCVARFSQGPKPFSPWLLRGTGSAAFKMFQREMTVLLNELKTRGAPDGDDQDISTQLYRVLQEHPHIPESRVLSEIGILFVEGFETTGHTTSWTLFNIASVPGKNHVPTRDTWLKGVKCYRCSAATTAEHSHTSGAAAGLTSHVVP